MMTFKVNVNDFAMSHSVTYCAIEVHIKYELWNTNMKNMKQQSQLTDKHDSTSCVCN